MRNRTIKELQAMTGANGQVAKRLVEAMNGAIQDVQEDTDYSVWDWDGAIYKGHDLVDGQEVHYLEVDVIDGGWKTTFTVEFEVNEYGIGFMNDYYEAY